MKYVKCCCIYSANGVDVEAQMLVKKCSDYKTDSCNTSNIVFIRVVKTAVFHVTYTQYYEWRVLFPSAFSL